MPDFWMDVNVALSEVPVNLMPLTDDTDFKSRETGVAFNAAGMDLVWNFVSTSGSFTQTAVTPTSGGAYDWTHQGDGIYTIEIPASGGASINNDTPGFGWFSGLATGVLPWRGPTIGFRAAGLNDLLIDSAYSTTRGLAGTALPAAAADAAGGLPISDAGGLDLDAILVDTGTSIPNAISALNDISPAEVNAEVVDALTTDTYAEPSAVPAATSSLKDKLNWIFALARNRITQTEDTQTLRNDANNGDIATSSVSDDGSTAVRGEWS